MSSWRSPCQRPDPHYREEMTKRSASLHAKIPPDLHKAIVAYARTEHYTVSGAVHRILADWASKHGRDLRKR